MAQRIEIAKVTCPAGTLQANAIETDLSFNPGIVTEVEIIIPDGHAGFTGIAIAQAHGIIIPAAGSDWIVGNDEYIRWPMDGYLNNGSWSAFTYNTGVNDHSWYLRFLVNENPLPRKAPTPLSAASITLGVK